MGDHGLCLLGCVRVCHEGSWELYLCSVCLQLDGGRMLSAHDLLQCTTCCNLSTAGCQRSAATAPKSPAHMLVEAQSTGRPFCCRGAQAEPLCRITVSQVWVAGTATSHNVACRALCCRYKLHSDISSCPQQSVSHPVVSVLF
jgi:hypothetical protein